MGWALGGKVGLAWRGMSVIQLQSDTVTSTSADWSSLMRQMNMCMLVVMMVTCELGWSGAHVSVGWGVGWECGDSSEWRE